MPILRSAMLVGAFLAGIVPASAQPAPASPPAIPARPPAGAAPAPSLAPAISETGPSEAERKPFVVAGFRSARFGSKEDAVRAAIRSDFPEAAGGIRDGLNDVDRTRTLTVAVPSLEPGPGPATVVYVFEATSRELIHVNVIWQKPATATDDERRELVAAGLQLVRYFRGFTWQSDRASVGVPVGPNSILLFGASDANKGGVEVRGDGVRFDFVGEDGKVVTSPQPRGGGALTISYARNVERPDVYRIPAGRF